MVGQPESPVYDPSVYQYELVDPVQGGVGGIANAPILALADRTAWLKQQLDLLRNGQLLPPNVAPLNGPAFTGSATAPNVAPGDDSTLIANTDFVQTARSGQVVVQIASASTLLTQPQWGVGIIIFQGVLAANSTVVFPQGVKGQWVLANFTTGPFSLTCRTPAGTVTIGLVQGFPRGAWSDGSALYFSNAVFSKNGEITTPDLAATGVTPGHYTRANLDISIDGRVVSASQGAGPTFAEVVAGLGFTPVEQGGGPSQAAGHKINLGYESFNGPRLSIDAQDQGAFSMRNTCAYTVQGVDKGFMSWPASELKGFFQIICGQAAVASSGTGPFSTNVTMPFSFSNSCWGVVANFIGNLPPAGGSVGSAPVDGSTVQITVNAPASATNGIVYIAFGF